MRKLILSVLCAVTVAAASAAPHVTHARAQQRYPWNGKVDITFEVTGLVADLSAKLTVATTNMADATAIPMTDLKDFATHTEVTQVTNGTYHLVWDSAVDCPDVRLEKVKTYVTVLNPLGNAPEGCEGVQLWENGPYWAEMNIGATSPTEDGLYFWWGDTVGYSPSSGNTFPINFDNASPANMTYNLTTNELVTAGYCETRDGTTVLKSEYDAAHVKWGGYWRMPTSRELDGLINSENCSWEWTTVNGVYGCRVTGKGAYATKSIFFAASGGVEGTSRVNYGARGAFWLAAPLDNHSEYAWALNFESSKFQRYSHQRYRGLPVRAVR